MKKIIIFGGSGFVGRYITEKLCKDNHLVTIISRTPEQKLFLKNCGNLGQVNIKSIDLENEIILNKELKKYDVVINLIGILYEKGKNSFNKIHQLWPQKLASLCDRNHNIKQFIHFSAICGINYNSKYSMSKYNGEKTISRLFDNYIIIRPSIIFGTEDNFFNKFAKMALFLPFLPLIEGGKTKFQPVFVEDVAAAIAKIINDNIVHKTYNAVGPEILSLKQIMQLINKYTSKKRFLVSIPYNIAKIIGFFAQFLPNPIITVDQVNTLKNDYIGNNNIENIDKLVPKLHAIEEIVPNYLSLYK